MKFIIAIILSLVCVTFASASVSEPGMGYYSTPEGTTGRLRLRLQADDTTAVDIVTHNNKDGARCKFSGLCVIDKGKIECDNLEYEADTMAEISGIVTENSIEFTHSNIKNVCPQGSLLGVYRFIRK